MSNRIIYGVERTDHTEHARVHGCARNGKSNDISISSHGVQPTIFLLSTLEYKNPSLPVVFLDNNPTGWYSILSSVFDGLNPVRKRQTPRMKVYNSKDPRTTISFGPSPNSPPGTSPAHSSSPATGLRLARGISPYRAGPTCTMNPGISTPT